MPRLKSQQVDKLFGQNYVVSNYDLTTANSSAWTAGSNQYYDENTVAINTVLNGIDKLFKFSSKGDNYFEGLATKYDIMLEMRSHNTRDPIKNGDSEIGVVVSDKGYVSGLSNIGGTTIDYVSGTLEAGVDTDVPSYDDLDALRWVDGSSVVKLTADTYDFDLAVDGGANNQLNITISSANPTIAEIVDLMQSAIDGASLSAYVVLEPEDDTPNANLSATKVKMRIYSKTSGSTSDVVLAAGTAGSSGGDLFAAMASAMGITGYTFSVTSVARDAHTANNVQIRFTDSSNELQISFDGGTNWGTAKTVTFPSSDNDMYLLRGGTGNTDKFVVLRITDHTTFDGIDGSGDLTDDDIVLEEKTGKYNLGFFYWLNGERIPYWYDTTSDPTKIDFGIPVVLQWSRLDPETQISSGATGGFLDIIGSGTLDINNLIVEVRAVTSQNTITNLSVLPADSSKTKLFVNGQRLVYGSSRDFTVSGQTITLNPSNMGYDVETYDTVEVEYFKS